jgi:hypothetical protein
MEANHMTPCLGGNLAVFSGVLRTPVGSDNGSFANTVAILGPQFGFAESTSFSRDVFKTHSASRILDATTTLPHSRMGGI